MRCCPVSHPGRLRLPLLLALAGASLGTRPAAAGLVVSVSSVAGVPVGSTGNVLEVDLTNTGSGAVAVGAFTFGIAAADPRITFTSADISTAKSYIFDGHSFDQDLGFSLNTSSGPSLVASDLYDLASAASTVGAGETVGLGRVFFDVNTLPGPGPIISVLLDGPNTSLTDAFANPLPIDTLSNGGITLVAAAVPEPSSLTLACLVLFGYSARRLVWKRRGLAR